MNKDIKEKIKQILKNNYIEDSPDLISELFKEREKEFLGEIERFIKDEKYADKEDCKAIDSFRGKDKIKMNEDMIKGYNIALKDLEQKLKELK